jgi:signal transduction histidine kinase/CheY-like chemotaxis protein
MIPAAIASLSLIGYIFGASPLYTIPTLTIIALQTATFILATSLALILCIPDVGIVRLGREDSPAGLLTRRLVPVLILVPIVLGILQVAGERAGLYDAAFGSAIRTVFAIGLFVLLLWSTGTALNRQTEQRKRAEEERERLLVLEREARAEAERQAMLKDEFLATLSHELRTPLHAILGWSEILRKDLGNRERALEALSVIERNGRIQTQLIGDLLDMSRIVSGTLRLDVQRVELSNVIEAAFEAVRPAAEAKDLTIGRHVAVVSEPVYGDPRRLQQVVWNVLSNAVKFTPKGGRIDIALDRADAHAEIRVTDTGEGIAPEFLPHLFERFRQADGTVARAHGGLGLGLALVRQLVELHGGEAHATSDGRGRGATFVIRLPLARIPASDGARQSFRRVVDAPVTRRRSDSLEGLHILVVEDEPDALRMVRRTLEDGGATVSTAPGTDEALNLLVQDRFDLVLSDIGLPGRDGHEFIRECRARGVTTPAIALTAFARAEDRRRALEAGYQDHLTKPLELAELLSAIAAFTGSRAGADAPPTHA